VREDGKPKQSVVNKGDTRCQTRKELARLAPKGLELAFFMLRRIHVRDRSRRNGRWVVTGSYDKTARLWLLQMNDLIDLARTIVGRNFFADEWQLYFPGEKYRKTFPDLPGPD
jgi:hypothetical protein